MRNRWKTNRLGERKTRLQEVEKWFRFAYHLIGSPDDLVQFARQPEFAKFRGKRPSIDRPDEILRHVIRFVFGFGSGAKRRVSRYANALEPAFKSGISAADIARHVTENGGINQMERANVRTPRDRRPAVLSIVTLKAEADDLTRRVLGLETGQQARIAIEMQTRSGNTATIKITSLKLRKSPKRSE
jgi:hypothetical protein